MGFNVQVLPNGQVVPGMIPGVPTKAKTQEAAFWLAMNKKRRRMNADEAFEECFGHRPNKVHFPHKVRVAILKRFLEGQ